MVRQVPSAAIDAKPTCVHTCSLLMVAVDTSVVSATVSMKVQYCVNKLLKNIKHLIKDSWLRKVIYVITIYKIKAITETTKKAGNDCYNYTVHTLSYHSARLVFPTSWPHGPESGLLWEAWAVTWILWVCSHPGLLQGTGHSFSPHSSVDCCSIHIKKSALSHQ